ncbi:MAG: tRNA dihydrouridine(20/20a) synthase DusA [Amylibacter sp.]|nr:tRNA dihydrouridine(20/20a) synthase DusA [Amylibacter sp.]MDC0096611.1 tRNA dihydrouridine(20/20a) synthase DusA [Amylibacter sp.]MDC0145885.1 tRNA dihydrouridine(20/20a) synthase DusA [Amylibacter sp.]MDG1963133.1 tRNA dihydrouridine(20/20a) synthase DusA [Amylibacter sp.]MDG2156900.1 tRNA dihydrouridine(20/20a) synthase DusA [Amylibacter sp.]
MKRINRTFSVAPMMDWTDRHCRYLHRLISKNVLLYTEMVTAPALIHGDADRLLEFNQSEHPIALQIGGSHPNQLAQATRLGCEAGYDEININIGCPSDRVQFGRFGACLMKEPELVSECVTAMKEASTGAEITVKCRIGVDDQEPKRILPDFIDKVSQNGVSSFTIHARKAWLSGLSPKQNRDVPPLDYELVHEIKKERPELEIILNGGLQTFDQAVHEINKGLDGAMIGRTAYHNPMEILANADSLFETNTNKKTVNKIIDEMLPYIQNHLDTGGRLNQITRHMLGLFSGQSGAKIWKRTLSDEAHKKDAGVEVVQNALRNVLEKQNNLE